MRIYNLGAFILGLTSYAFMWWAVSWQAALAMFLALWANNLGRRRE